MKSMIKVSEVPIKINTPNGVGIIENVIITALGYVQLRVKFEEDPGENDYEFIKYNIGNLDKILKTSKLSLVKEKKLSTKNA